MIQVRRFINELMSSNCYVVFDQASKRCIIIDPGSEKCVNEIEFISTNNLILDYIILTHEHTDHTWGCNTLVDKYDPKVICSEQCKNNLPYAGDTYFRLYYERDNYSYTVKHVDYTTEYLHNMLLWNNISVRFIDVPGHSMGSICINIDKLLFTGDALMQYKPYINKRDGNHFLYQKSINNILSGFSNITLVYPGHGDSFQLKDYNNYD